MDNLTMAMDGAEILTTDMEIIGDITPIITHGATPTMDMVTVVEAIILETGILPDLWDLLFDPNRENALTGV